MQIEIIGAPVDLGANRRGVNMGPSAIRFAGLKQALSNIGIFCVDKGDIFVNIHENIEIEKNSAFKYAREIIKVNTTLSQSVSESIEAGNFPIVLGGDHSIAIGTILGTQQSLKSIGVLWIDAHGDYNTEKTSLSGNLHGMALAACTGEGALDVSTFKENNVPFIDPSKVVLVGIRDLDKEEARLLKKANITIFTMEDIDIWGMHEIMKRALQIVEKDTAGFHLSFDMDALNPMEAPGVGTPVVGGLTFREAHLAAEMISSSKKLRSAEFVELNPVLDHENKTGELAVSLICSIVGKRIFDI